MAEKKLRKKMHRLGRANEIKLVDEIRRTWQTYVVAERPSYPEAAKHYSTILQFEVLASHVQGMIANLDGYNWPGGHGNGKTAIHKSDRVRALAYVVAQLIDSLGETRPEVLTKILAGKYSQDDMPDAEAGPLFGGPRK